MRKRGWIGGCWFMRFFLANFWYRRLYSIHILGLDIRISSRRGWETMHKTMKCSCYKVVVPFQVYKVLRCINMRDRKRVKLNGKSHDSVPPIKTWHAWSLLCARGVGIGQDRIQMDLIQSELRFSFKSGWIWFGLNWIRITSNNPIGSARTIA